MTIGTADEGTFTPAMNLPGDDYPNPPQLLNFDAAQAINASTNFDFIWGSFTNGTTNDVIRFEIDDAIRQHDHQFAGLRRARAVGRDGNEFPRCPGDVDRGTTNIGSLLFVKVLPAIPTACRAPSA